MPRKDAGFDFLVKLNAFVMFYGSGTQEYKIDLNWLNRAPSEIVAP